MGLEGDGMAGMEGDSVAGAVPDGATLIGQSSWAAASLEPSRSAYSCSPFLSLSLPLCS